MDIFDQQHTGTIDGASFNDGCKCAKFSTMTRRVVHCQVQAARTLRDHQQIGDERFFFDIDSSRDERVVESGAPSAAVTFHGNAENATQQRMDRVATLFGTEVEHGRRVT